MSVRNKITDAMNCIDRYPDPETVALREAISKLHREDEIKLSDILCSNGISEMLMALMRGLLPKKVLIPVPTYTGYERAIRAAGGSVEYFYLSEKTSFQLDESFIERLGPEIDMVVLCDPNNPTGRAMEKALWKDILKVAEKNNITIVIDKSYAYLSNITVCTCGENVIHLYSMTKLFAMPGIRLGYMVCKDRSVVERVSAQLPEWNVSLIAGEAGVAACELMTREGRDSGDLVETGFLTDTLRVIKKEREFLSGELKSLGFKVYPSDSCFILFRDETGEKPPVRGPKISEKPPVRGQKIWEKPESGCQPPYPFSLYESLLNRGLLIRDCSDIEGLSAGFYRIGIKKHEDNKRLMDEIRNLRY